MKSFKTNKLPCSPPAGGTRYSANRNKTLILKSLHINESDFLGKGVESYVYVYGKNKVVRILKNGDLVYIKSLKELQELISTSGLLVETPLIIKIQELGGIIYTVERRLKGINLTKIFDTYNDEQKKKVILEYLDLLKELTKVDVNKFEFGQITNSKDKVSDSSWQGFLKKKTKQKVNMVKIQLGQDVLDLDFKLDVFFKLIDAKLENIEKNLVHGDYFYDNVMANKDAKITGILDFSGWMSVVGDFRLDVSGAIIFLEHSEKFVKYQKILTEAAKIEYGDDIESFIDFYKIYYSLYLSDSCLYLKPLYNWCVKNLNDKELWARVM